MKTINSPIFGLVRDPTVLEKEIIKSLIDACPVAVFQELNKLLNVGDLCISIETIEEQIEQEKG